MMRKVEQVVDSLTSDGASDSFIVVGGAYPAIVYISGEFGGGTLTLEAITPDGTWVPVRGYTFTEPQVTIIDFNNLTCRFSLTGSTGANLNAWVSKI